MMQEAPVVQRKNNNNAALISQAASNLAECQGDERNSADIFSKLLALMTPGTSTDAELEELFGTLETIMELDDYDSDDNGEDMTSTSPSARIAAPNSSPKRQTPPENETTVADNRQTTWHRQQHSRVNEILDMQLYMTAKGESSEQFSLPNARLGRPDLKSIFVEMRGQAVAAGEKRVAVCVCAPPRISQICRKACIVYSDKNVCFDFHTESMEG